MSVHTNRGRGRRRTPGLPRLRGFGPPGLLLHGLAGHAAEWDVLAELLLPTHRVIAYDARGHGASDRHPPSVTRTAYVRDVVAVITQLALAPAALIGQSLGGHTAMLTAAAHPSLVQGRSGMRSAVRRWSCGARGGWMPESGAYGMRTRSPTTEVRVIRAAAHDVHLDQPRALYEEIADFLKMQENIRQGTVEGKQTYAKWR